MAAAPAPTKLLRVILDIGLSPPGEFPLRAIIPRGARLGKDDGGAGDADIGPMRRRVALLLLMGLVAAGCEPSARPPPPYFAIPAGSAPPRATAAPAEGAPAVRPVTRDNPEVQYFLPSHPGDIQRAPADVPEPGRSAGPFSTPPYSGPITGYGPGGMAQPPGAPPNPPYPPGGLTGPR